MISEPYGGSVILIVYDDLGGEVETILNLHMNGRNHKVLWKVANIHSGMYFETMEAESFPQTGKVFVLM